MDIIQVLNSLAEYSAKYFYSTEDKAGGINCISDMRPHYLSRAETIWNFICVETAEIVNDKLIIYARDPMFLISSRYIPKNFFDFIQKKLKEEYDLVLGVAKFEKADTRENHQEYTNRAWYYFGPYLKELYEKFGSKEYVLEMERIFE